MRILIISDNGVPTGYGRIADEVAVRLTKRGHSVLAMSYYYDGLLPPQLDGESLPYHVGVLQGKPNQVGEILKVMSAFQPDVVLSVQDFPYHVQLYQSPYDWSTVGRVLITPVDGVPIFPDWLSLVGQVDAAMTISEFGVKAFAKAGYQVGLCKPAVNLNRFYKMGDSERADLRAKLGLAPDAFLLGTMAQNQGRKAISLMLQAFYAFAQDKPDARYLLDMEEISPAGWHLPHLCQQYGWDVSKLIFRSDAVMAGVQDLRDRYNVLDAHVVLSTREGYGLPLAEAMACGVVSIAQDYCSGPEIVGDGRGVLVPTTGYAVPGTWGGAEDHYPDLDAYVAALNRLYHEPHERAVMAERGMRWARAHTWDNTADAVEMTLRGVYDGIQQRRAEYQQPVMQPVTALVPQASPDGQHAQEMALVEAEA